jgi:hypothetical protein
MNFVNAVRKAPMTPEITIHTIEYCSKEVERTSKMEGIGIGD